MSIDAYVTIMLRLYIGVFLLSVITGILILLKRIMKKNTKFWWIILCSIHYSIFATFNSFTAYIAYDDSADPNYHLYKGWELHNFILNDIKMLAIWVFIVGALYFISEKIKGKGSAKKGIAALVVFLAVLLVIIILLSFTRIS